MGFIKSIFKLAFGLIAFVVVGGIAIGIFVDPETEKNSQNQTQFSPSSTAKKECAEAKATGKSYGITGSSINVRKGPGTNFDKIVNQKATNALGQTHYVQVDNTVTVYEACRKSSWSYIEVTKPEWLSKSHRGWISSQFLRGQVRDSSGIQVFTEKDFIWDDKISPYKKIIIAGVNKIHKDNARCKNIDTSSAYLSGSKSTPTKPVFFVTCGSGAGAFNVWFSKDDLESDRTLSATTHINQSTAVSLCEQHARSVATHPSTVDFSRIMDLAIEEHPNGRTTIFSTFTAKNSFNLEVKFRIRCLVDASGLFEASVNEVR